MDDMDQVCVLLAQPLGILTTLGYIKRIRHPQVRINAGVFTACTQTLLERDEQVQTRRALVELANSQESRFEYLRCGALALAPEVWWKVRMIVDNKNGEIDAELIHRIGTLMANESEVDAELVHRINTLYDSKAIFWKSMMVGVSLGTLPFFLNNRYFFGGNFLDAIKQLDNATKQSGIDYDRHRRALLSGGGHALNCTYALPIGLSPYLNPDLSFGVTWAQRRAISFIDYRQYKSPAESMRKNVLWYEREGKLPIFQYNVEEK
jgi:hypothetical protein